ncbi:hypothetical protein [Streptomyces sp. NBC_00343]|uniref:hypothetical protein n=1 Tax=Streptomyces sp. NBC_00343 TaxID=2975719 RepID=UPI002E280C9F|nr:hypothetical protein [Streptomyces sp. NBC_00343]
MKQAIPWWVLLVAFGALLVGAVLILSGRATAAEAASFIAPLFALLTALYTAHHGANGEKLSARHEPTEDKSNDQS